MKSFGLIIVFTFIAGSIFAQDIKPYIIGFESTKSISTLKEQLVNELEVNDFKVVGEYQPAEDSDRWLIIYTSGELLDAVKMVGDLTGFAATQRIAITVEEGKSVVSYTNPTYWGNAYFRDDFPKVSSKYSTLEMKLKKALRSVGTYSGLAFGSEDGIEVDDLREYQYMMGMPEFDDTVELAEFSDFASAKAKVDANVMKGIQNVKSVYKVEIPDKKLVLYGFALVGETGESKFMPIIDLGSPKHTAFLPYEILIHDNKVSMLHGRYRIALSFPDLTMGTFSKIMSTPGEIEDLLKQVVK